MQTSGAQKYSVVTDLIRQHQRFFGQTLITLLDIKHNLSDFICFVCLNRIQANLHRLTSQGTIHAHGIPRRPAQLIMYLFIDLIAFLSKFQLQRYFTIHLQNLKNLFRNQTFNKLRYQNVILNFQYVQCSLFKTVSRYFRKGTLINFRTINVTYKGLQ